MLEAQISHRLPIFETTEQMVLFVKRIETVGEAITHEYGAH